MERIPGDRCTPNSSLSSSEEEVNIYLKVIKTVALNVKRSETIRNLKAMLCKKEGISENFQELYFSGERLNDNDKLVDCGIQKNSTLHLVLQTSGVMKLFVIVISKQKTIEVEAKSQDTIQSIKAQVHAKEGILSHQFSLFFAGRLLENYRTLASLGIKGQSTLQLVFNPRDVLSVSVKMPTGTIVKTEVKLLYTVGDVKSIVGSMVDFPVSDHCLIYEGKQLEDLKTLACYDLKEDSVLEILPSNIQIFVKVWSGKTITLYVQQKETIEDVMEKLGRPPNECYSLMFAGKRLDDGRDLASYGIKEQSTLTMVIHPRTLVLPFMLSKIGDFQPDILRSTTIGKLKKLIETKQERKVKEVLLRGQALEDCLFLWQYAIDKDTKLGVVFQQG